MSRATNARIAGFTFLLYIGAGVFSMVVSGWMEHGAGVSARLAAMAQHRAAVGVEILLVLVQVFSALILAVTLHGLTREQDPDLALMGMTCRIAEGLMGAVVMPRTLGLLWLATSAGQPGAPDAAAAQAIAAFLFQVGTWTPVVGGTFFAVGSASFAWLFLRGRMIPRPLAWLGLVASLLLVVGLPLRLAGLLQGPIAWLLWLPMAAFEIPLGLWLLVAGAAAPAGSPSVTMRIGGNCV